MHGRGACVAVGECVAGRGMHGRGHAWWGVCMAGGVRGSYYEIRSMRGRNLGRFTGHTQS